MSSRDSKRVSGNFDKSKQNNSGTEGSKSGKEKCDYCHVAGHFEYECRTKLRDLSERYEKDKTSTRSERPRGGALITKNLLSMPPSEASYNDWCLDSGATSHMTGRREWLIDMKSTQQSVRVGDGTVLQAMGKGNVTILAHDGKEWVEKYLKYVLYIPQLKFNLFSLGASLDKGLTQDATKDKCLLKLNGSIQAVGDRLDNLYKMRFKLVEPDGNSGSAMALVSLKTWHERLGHQHYSHIKTLLKSRGIKATGEKQFCEPCVLGKMTRTPHPVSSSRSTEVPSWV